MSFEQDVINRTTQKLAAMMKVAERDGEEADLQPTWFESFANSAPVSGMLDFLDQSGFSDAFETGQQALGENLGNLLNDAIPDTDVAAADKLVQDQDDWKQDKEFRAIRQSNRAEKARALDAQDRQNRIRNLVTNGYRPEGGLQNLADLLGIKSTADYAMNPADVNLSNPESFLSGIRDSMNRTDLSEGYSQLKRRGLDSISDIRNQVSTRGQDLLDRLKDADDVVSSNIQNIPGAFQSIFNPLVQPITNNFEIADNAVKDIYDSMARGAERMSTPEYKRRQLAERQALLQAEADRRSGNKFTRAGKAIEDTYNSTRNDINNAISAAKVIVPQALDDAGKKVKRQYVGAKNSIDQYMNDKANKARQTFENTQDALDKAFYNDNAISQGASNIGNWFFNNED